MYETVRSYRQIESQLIVPTPAPYVGPGDIVAGAAGWWGLRAYSRGAIGLPVVQLIASADAGLTGNTSDFVALTNGSLDVASIATFLAANPATSLFVKKLYDQTGNGLHLISFAQVSNYVPKFQLSGLGALPIVLIDSFNMNLSNQSPAPQITGGSPLTAVMVNNIASGATGEIAFEFNQEAGNVDKAILQYNSSGTNPNTLDMQESVATTFYVSSNIPCTDDNWHSVATVFDAANSFGYVDGSGIAFPSAVAIPSHSTCQVGIFSTPFGGSSAKGKGAECGLWLSALGSGQIAALNANQHAYWRF